MKKKTKHLMLLIIILFILCGIWLLVNFISQKDAERKEEESASESLANTIYLISAEDIIGFVYNNGETDMAFSYDGQWTYDSDPNFVVNQTRLNDFKNVLLKLTAEKTLEAKDDLSAYGLEEPVYSIKITGSQGENYVLNIGEMASSGDYYAQMDGEQEIYTISQYLISYLSDDLMEFVASITAPSLSVDNVKELTMTAGSQTLKLVRANGEWSFSITSEAGIQSGIVANTITITDILETMNGFTGDNCVDYYCEESEKTDYGLEVPSVSAEVVYTDENGNDISYYLYVGSAATESTRYYMNSGTDMVGTIAQTRVDALYEAFAYTYSE